MIGRPVRGGSPTTFDRLLGTRLGAAAIRAVQERRFGRMVCLKPPAVDTVPIARAIARPKLVPPDSDTVRAARALGISFGDEGH